MRLWNDLFTLVLIPLFVRIVTELFAYWLNKRGDE
ncbi:type I toxin-antitoxin system Fst family toxin [Atopococcus tabaci]